MESCTAPLITITTNPLELDGWLDSAKWTIQSWKTWASSRHGWVTSYSHQSIPTNIGANVPRLARRSPKPLGWVRFSTVPATTSIFTSYSTRRKIKWRIWECSSVGQSIRLLTEVSGIRVPPLPPTFPGSFFCLLLHESLNKVEDMGL